MPDPAPVVALRPITAETWREAARLLVREDQRTFVANNAASLAQMHFEPCWECLGAFAGDRMVGEVDAGEIVFRWTAPPR